MRSFIYLALALACVGGFIAHHRQQTAVETPAATVASAKGTPSTTSPHNWMKSSLDRANDVKRQVAAERKSNGQ